MKKLLRDVGYAGLGLGITVKEKAQKLGHALKIKGKESKERKALHERKEEIKKVVKERMGATGHEAMVISRKSLQMLERELKKLERQSRKAKRPTKKARKKRR